MKFKNPMLVVSDMERSKAFYEQVLGLRVVADLGANITLTGGVCLQTKDSWEAFIEAAGDDIHFGGKNAEIYFEEENFDAFAEHLKKHKDLQYVHPVKEHRWGQRVVRFYDPDLHIIEVGESLKDVCKRFLDSGMTVSQVAQRMDVPEKMIKSMMPGSEDPGKLLANLDKLKTTEAGAGRIKKNLGLDTDQVVEWCRQQILLPDAKIRRNGKNWYVHTGGSVLTINGNNYSIITAHKE